MGEILTVKLTDKQLKSLQELAADTTEPRIAKRAQVILCAARGMSLREIAAEVGLGWKSCLKWRKRFLEKRLEGLFGEPRPGRPVVFDAEKQRDVIDTVLNSPQGGAQRPSFRQLAGATGQSRSTIHRALSALSFKPQTVNYWHENTAAKVIGSQKPDFLGFFLSYPQSAVAFSLWNENFSIADLKDPWAEQRMSPPEGEKFWNFLEHLCRFFPHENIHVMVNEYGPYRHDGILERVSEQERPLKLYFTPPRFSWRDQVYEVIGYYNRFVRAHQSLLAHPLVEVYRPLTEPEKWHRLENDLLQLLASELKGDGIFPIEPYEGMCFGRELSAKS